MRDRRIQEENGLQARGQGASSLGLQAMGQEEGSMGTRQDWCPRAQSRMGPAVTISLEERWGASQGRRSQQGDGEGHQVGCRRRKREISGAWGGGGRLSHSPWQGRAAPA